ncbi:MAG: hypothetical protein RL736_19 [Pseudomonadota bacterium]|jgi:hypothetical protein
MGIQLSTNFDLPSRIPLDSRYVVETYSQLTGSAFKYAGMQGYVTQTQKLYFLEDFNSNKWSQVITTGAAPNPDAPVGVKSIINTTYSELTGLKANNALAPGQYYRISDFHLMWWNQSLNDKTVKSGLAPEPLIVLATSGNKILHQAISEIYPQDTVYYDIDASGSYSWGQINNNLGISGFKGWIYRRIDNKLNIDIGWDWRNITVNCCRPDSSSVAVYDTGITYNMFNVVKSDGGNKLYYSLTDRNLNNPLLASSAGYWSAVTASSYELTTYYPTDEEFGFRAYCKTGLLINLPADTGTRIQQPTFTNSVTSQGSFNINKNVYDIEIKGGWCNVFYNGDNSSFNRVKIAHNCYLNLINCATLFTYNNIGFNFIRNVVQASNMIGNTIGDTFSANVISNFQSNIIGIGTTANLFGQIFNNNQTNSILINCSFGTNFNNNILGNNIRYNKFGVSCQLNTIGNNFQNNTIGNTFQNNTIGNTFQNNTIGNSGQNNTIANNFVYNTGSGAPMKSNTIEDSISACNFSNSSHIYSGTYNKRIFRNSSGAVRLSYFNDNDQLVVTDAT